MESSNALFLSPEEKAARWLEANGVLRSVAGDEDHAAMSKSLAYVKEHPVEKRGVLLTGPVGVGKTHAAMAMAKAFYRYTSVFLGPDKWEVAQSAGPSSLRSASAMGVAYIVDDLGRSGDRNDYGNRSNPWLSFLYTWASLPAENAPILIITTNLNSKALSEYCGDAIVSRLVERLVVCRMTGRDKRMDRAVVF